jgi:hypothetical protein
LWPNNNPFSFFPLMPLPSGASHLPLPQAPSFRPYAAIEGYAAVLPESKCGVIEGGCLF